MYRTHLAALALEDAQSFKGDDYADQAKRLALQDVSILTEADRQYGSSWLQRGGVGAYIVGIRKADRIAVQLLRHGNNMHHAVRGDTRPEGIMNDLRDLRRYLYLWDSQAQELGYLFVGDAVMTGDDTTLRHPLIVADAVEATVKAFGYDLFAAIRDQRPLLGMLRWWRRHLLEWELVLTRDGALPLTAMEEQHQRRVADIASDL